MFGNQGLRPDPSLIEPTAHSGQVGNFPGRITHKLPQNWVSQLSRQALLGQDFTSLRRVQERPPEHTAEVMRVVHPHGDCVLA
jgi:hypothetical protein